MSPPPPTLCFGFGFGRSAIDIADPEVVAEIEAAMAAEDAATGE